MGPNRQSKRDSKKSKHGKKDGGGRGGKKSGAKSSSYTEKRDRDAPSRKSKYANAFALGLLSPTGKLGKKGKTRLRGLGPVPFLGMGHDMMKQLKGLLLEYNEARREVETIREEDEVSIAEESEESEEEESEDASGDGSDASPAAGAVGAVSAGPSTAKPSSSSSAAGPSAAAPKPPLAQPKAQKAARPARIDIDSGPSESEYSDEDDLSEDDDDEEEEDDSEFDDEEEDEEASDMETSEEGSVVTDEDNDDFSKWADRHAAGSSATDDSEEDDADSDSSFSVPDIEGAEQDQDEAPVPYEISSLPAFRLLALAGFPDSAIARAIDAVSLPSYAHEKARQEAGSLLFRTWARLIASVYLNAPEGQDWQAPGDGQEKRDEAAMVLGAMFPESFTKTDKLLNLESEVYRVAGVEPPVIEEGKETEGGEVWTIGFEIELPEGVVKGSATSTAPAVAASSGKSKGKGKESKPPCFFFSQGKCNKGDRCPFPHIAPSESGSQPGMTSSASPTSTQALLIIVHPRHRPSFPLLIFPQLEALAPEQRLAANQGAWESFERGGAWEAVEWARERGGRTLLESIPLPKKPRAVQRAMPNTIRLKIGDVATTTSYSSKKGDKMVTSSRDIKEGRTLVTILEKPYDGPPIAGTVADILTRGDHHRGIKVRLTDGRVGRVKEVFGESGGRANWKTAQLFEEPVDKAGAKTMRDVVQKLDKLGVQGDGIRKALGIAAGKGPLNKIKLAVREEPELSSSPSFSAAYMQPQSPPPVASVSSGPAPDKALSTRLLEDFKKLQQTPKYLALQPARQGLPAFSKKDEIVKTVRTHRVTVVEGETGCGKSTQVPQYILDDALLSGKGAETKILVTQPRRISAIGVSDRVAKERGGEVGGEVGYQIRLESRLSEKTKIMFVTAGILLRRLEGGGDEGISDISHIVLDEVHERSLESDFLLLVLRQLLPLRPDLKVILMSATLNAELFQGYFGGDTPRLVIPGRTFPVRPIFLEEALKMTDYVPEGDLLKKALRQQAPRDPEKTVDEIPDGQLSASELAARYPTLSKEQVKSLMLMDEEKIQYPLIEKLVVQMVGELLPAFAKSNTVVGAAPSGKNGNGKGKDKENGRSTPSAGTSSEKDAPNRGILVFLPGYAEISTLFDLLSANSTIRSATSNGKLLLPLHGVLSSEEQVRVFDRPPEGSCKIVIATNVAETSITIDDVVFVVDSGKMKETRFEASKGMSSLEECWVSRANALQRRGRAGRVQAGTCYHMFTSHRFENVLLAQQLPEIRRTPLDQICLRIKTLTFLRGRIAQILADIIEPPSADAVQAAIVTLRTLQALTKEEQLTPLGFHLGHLPVDVRIGKLILYGAIFGCLDPVLTIAAALSVKSPFVAPFDKREMADERKHEFSMAFSDHLTVLNAYNQWLLQRGQGFAQERRWLFDNFLSGRTLGMLASVKRQLVELLSDIGFVKSGIKTRDLERAGGLQGDGVKEALSGSASNDRSGNMELVKGTLIAALYPNVIKLESSGGANPAKGKQRKHSEKEKAGELRLIVRGADADQVFIHPSSINYRTKEFPHPFLVYLEKIRTTKVYVRDSSCVSPYAMAFFGGRLTWDGAQGYLNMDDGWIRFKPSSPAVALLLEATRTAFNELLALKISDPGLDVSKVKLISAIVDLVSGAGLQKHHYKVKMVETVERSPRPKPTSSLSGMWDHAIADAGGKSSPKPGGGGRPSSAQGQRPASAQGQRGGGNQQQGGRGAGNGGRGGGSQTTGRGGGSSKDQGRKGRK